MKKWGKFIIAVIIVVIIAIVSVVIINKNKKIALNVSTAKELSDLIEKIYDIKTISYPSLDLKEIDVSDEVTINSLTGLENGDKLDYLVVSQPLINAQAFEFVLAKVKDGVNADSVAKEIFEKANPRRWVCVSAEKVCVTSSGNVVCLVMTDEDNALNIFEVFKQVAGKYGKEYVKDVEEEELPPDSLPSFEVPEGYEIESYPEGYENEVTTEENPVDSNVTNSVTE